MIAAYIMAPILLALAYYYDIYALVYAVFLLFFLNFYKSYNARPSKLILLSIAVFLLIHNSWLLSLYKWVGIFSASLIYIGFTLYFCLIIYLFLWAIGLLKRLPLSCVLIPFIWVVFELALSLGPFGYPLYSLYLTQASSPYLFLSQNIFGAEMISFLIIFVCAYSAVVFKSKNTGTQKMTQLFLIIFIFIFTLSYGAYIKKYKQVRHDRYLNLVMVQPNIKQKMKMESQHFYSNFSHYIQLIKHVRKSEKNIDAIIFPETLIPALWETHFSKELLKQGVLDGELLIFGLPIRRSGNIYNSILFYQDGQYKKEYRKNQLVPFGESMPIPFYESKTQLYYKSGEGIHPVSYQSVKYGLSICFESAFFKVFRKLQASDIFIVLTNDDWFNSWFKELHLRTAVFRAVEFNKYLLFVTNTGKTAIICNEGEIIETLADNKMAYMKYRVPLIVKSRHSTVYFLVNAFAVLVALISIKIILKFI